MTVAEAHRVHAVQRVRRVSAASEVRVDTQGHRDRRGYQARPVGRKVRPVPQDRQEWLERWDRQGHRVSRVLQELQVQPDRADREGEQVKMAPMAKMVLPAREDRVDDVARKVTRVIPELPAIPEHEAREDDAGQQALRVLPDRLGHKVSRESPAHRQDRMAVPQEARCNYSNYDSIPTVA